MVRGKGMGGPSQEFALILALKLEGVEGWAAFAVDTDGNDGPTDAAGGMVTGETARAIREGRPNSREALKDNDAHTALSAGGALLLTGPTGTNVNDLRVALTHRRSGNQGVIARLVFRSSKTTSLSGLF
jgi:glycerate 2-kinase